MKRIISLILLLCLLLPCATANAGSYASDISSVMSSFRLNNYSCDSAAQQEVNGSYRMVEMLEIVALEFGAASSDVSSVMSSFRLNN